MTTPDPLSLMAQAALVIDTLDDIDAMADIGGPMDELATLREELLGFEAITRVSGSAVPADQIVRAFRDCDETPWRLAWLTRHSTVTDEDAERVSRLCVADLERLAQVAGDASFRAALMTAVSEVSTDLVAALALHRAPGIPETVPSTWTDDVIGR